MRTRRWWPEIVSRKWFIRGKQFQVISRVEKGEYMSRGGDEIAVLRGWKFISQIRKFHQCQGLSRHSGRMGLLRTKNDLTLDQSKEETAKSIW